MLMRAKQIAAEQSADHDAFERSLNALSSSAKSASAYSSERVTAYSAGAVLKGQRQVKDLRAALEALPLHGGPPASVKKKPDSRRSASASKLYAAPRVRAHSAGTLPPRSASTARLLRPVSSGHPGVPGERGTQSRVGNICVLPCYVRKAVLELFDAFAAQQECSGPTSPPSAQPVPVFKQPFSKAAGRGNGATMPPLQAIPKLAPTKKGFEQLLRLYHGRTNSDEIEAMLAVVAKPLDALVRGRWAARTKAQYGHAIRRAFAKADKDGSGGIDVSEFAMAVAAAKIDEAHVRALFDAADQDGNGVLDLDEFMGVVSSSNVLQTAFEEILRTAEERRERTENQRLACIFRSPAVRRLRSPSGRRSRPSLSHLRPMDEVAVRYETMPLAPVPYSPVVPVNPGQMAAKKLSILGVR